MNGNLDNDIMVGLNEVLTGVFGVCIGIIIVVGVCVVLPWFVRGFINDVKYFVAVSKRNRR